MQEDKQNPEWLSEYKVLSSPPTKFPITGDNAFEKIRSNPFITPCVAMYPMRKIEDYNRVQ